MRVPTPASPCAIATRCRRPAHSLAQHLLCRGVQHVEVLCGSGWPLGPGYVKRERRHRHDESGQKTETRHNVHEHAALPHGSSERALLAVLCAVLLADQSALAFPRVPALAGGRPAVGKTCAGPARQAVRNGVLAMRGAEGEKGQGTLRSAEQKPFGVGGGELRILRDVPFRFGMPAREVAADLSPSLAARSSSLTPPSRVCVCVCVCVRACVRACVYVHSCIYIYISQVWVWVPPGYQEAREGGQRYPVIYCQDGQNKVSCACVSL